MNKIKNYFLLYLCFIGVQTVQAMMNIPHDVTVYFLRRDGEVTSKRYAAGALDTQQWYSPITNAYNFATCLTEFSALVLANSCESGNAYVFELITQGFLMRLTQSLEEAFAYADKLGYKEADEYRIGMQIFKATFYDKSIINAISKGLEPILPILHYIKHNSSHANQHAITLCSAYMWHTIKKISPFKEYIKTTFAKAYLIPSSTRQILKAIVRVRLGTLQQFGVLEKRACPYASVSPITSSLITNLQAGVCPSRLAQSNASATLMAASREIAILPQQPSVAYSKAKVPSLPIAVPCPSPRPGTPIAQPAPYFTAPQGSSLAALPRPQEASLLRPEVPPRAPSPMPAVSSPAAPKNSASPRVDASQNFNDPESAAQFIIETFGHRHAIRNQGFNKGVYKAYLLNNFTVDQLKLLADFFDSKGGRLVRSRQMSYNEVTQGGVYAFFAGKLLILTPEERAEFLTSLRAINDNDLRNSLIFLRQKVEQRIAPRFASPIPAMVPTPSPMSIDAPESVPGVKRKHADNFICSICLDEFEEPSLMTTLNCTCNFYYHRNCLETWWKERPKEKKGRKRKKETEANKECPTCHKKNLTLHDPRALKKK